MAINKELFKQNLWDRGIEMSDQEIDHFIALQSGVDSLGPLVIEEELSEDIYNVVEHWEDGDRAQRHNNPGSHAWTPERAEKYGAEKGDPFVGTDADGNEQTYYTAKYATLDQGTAASKDVTSSIMRTVRNSTGLDYDDPGFSEAFASHYSGLEPGDSLDNYSESIQNVIERNTYHPNRNPVAGTLENDSYSYWDMVDVGDPNVSFSERLDRVGGLGNLMMSPALAPNMMRPTRDEFRENRGLIDSALSDDPYAGLFDIDYAQYNTPEERNAAVDFIGNFAWNLFDTGTFGILGAADYDDIIQDWLTGEEGPSTFSGRVGAGLGGLGGFIGPMGAARGATKMLVKAGKYGTKTFNANVAKEGVKFLSKEAGVKGKGYKAFNKLTEEKQIGFFKAITDDIVQSSTKFAQQSVDDAFAKTLTKTSPKVINDLLKAHGLPNTPANIQKIKGIVEKALTANGGRSVIPISTLQQRIALALGGTQGSNKAATIASHMLEEGILFAMVETPMEIFQSMNEEREMDLFGRAKHAFLLGNALGVIRMVPGGKTWVGNDGNHSSISKEAFRGAMRKISTNRPYKDLDLNNETSGDILLRMVKSAWENMGSGAPKFVRNSLKGFRSNTFKRKGVTYPDVLDDMDIVLKEQLDMLAYSREGRERLVKILDDLHGNWEKGWGPIFLKEVMEDLSGSSFRMIAGSMAFNYELAFDDRIPLEDKIFHTLLGAWMTKQGRKVDFRNNQGKLETFVPAPERVSDRYVKSVEYLGELNMTPLDFTLNALAKGKKLETEYIQSAADSEDVGTVLKLIKKYNLAIDPEMPNPVGVKNRGKTGAEPVYDFLKSLIDGGYIPMEGMKLLDPYHINKAQLKKFIAELSELKFADSKLTGIKTPKDLSDLIYEASDKSFAELSRTHLEAAIEIHNHLVGNNGKNNIVLPADGSLPNLPQILSKDAKSLDYANDLLLQKYSKLLLLLENKELIVDRSAPRTVDDSNFAGLAERVELFDKRVNKLITGGEGEIHASLALEGWTGELLNRYHNKKGIRITHELLNNLETGNWRDPGGGVKHDGRKVSELQNEIFVDKDSGFLYSDIKFGKNVDPSLQSFISAYFHVMKTNPTSRTTFLDEGTRVLEIRNGASKEAKAAVELRSVLQKNRIGGFSHMDVNKTAAFIKEYEMYSIDRHISGATKRDGKPLNDYDRAVLNELIRSGLIGRNFELVDIQGIIDPLRVQGKATEANLKNISKLFKVNFKDKDIEKFLSEDVSLDTIFEQIARRNGQSKALTLKDLMESYNELIEPYIMDGKGNGVLKPASRAIAEVELTEMYSWITRLSSLKKIREVVTAKDLVSQFEKLSKDKDLDKQSREYIEYVYRNIDNKNFNHKELIAALSNKGLYDVLENKLKIDTSDPKLTDQLREIFESKQYDLVKSLDQTIINNTIRDYKGLFEKDSDVDIYINASRESIRKKYNLGENYDFSKATLETLIRDGYIEVSGKKHYLYGKKTNNDADMAMTESERGKFLADITKMVYASGQERSLKRLYVTGSGVYTDFDFKMFDNSLFRTLDLLLTDVNNKKKLETGFSIIDLSFTDNKMNKFDIRQSGNKKYRKELLKALEGDTLIDKDLKTDIIGQLRHEKGEGVIMIGMGDLNYGIGIDKASLPALGSNLYKKLDQWKKTYSDAKYDKIHKTLSQVFNRAFEKVEVIDQATGKKTGEFEFEFKQRKKNREAEDLEILITTAFLDGPNKKLGLQKFFWDHLVETHGTNEGMKVTKLARRIRLMANTSMKELSKDHVKNTINLYQKFGASEHGVRKSADADMIKTLKRIDANNGFKIVIAADENFKAGEASILKELDSQIKKAKDNNPDLNLVEVTKNEKTGELEFNGGGDISSVDSYTAVSPQMMKALYALSGANNVDGLGGVKPLIHRFGDGLILGKTAFISDPSFNKFFKNNDVDMIMMQSAAKAHYNPSKVLTGWGSVEKLREIKFGNREKDLIETIGIDEISLGAVVNSNKGATLPQQTFKDLNIAEGTRAYEWLIENKVKDLNNTMGEVFDTKSLDAHAFAQYLNESRSTDNSNSLYQRLITHKFNPLSSLVRNDFLNNVKSHTIDKAGIITPKTEYGTQSVTSPGDGLRYTLFEQKEGKTGLIENSIYSYGQIDIPSINANKKVVLRDLHIIEHNPSSKDRLIPFSELSKEIKDVRGKEFKGNPTFSDMYQSISAYNNKKGTNYEIAVTVRRNPNTRPGDVSIVGVRDILSSDYGNTVKLNAYDFAMRHEGDHDIDKIDVWWDTPNQILTKWQRLSGEVIRVNPDKEIKKTTLSVDNYGGKQLDWLEPGAMSKYRDDIYASEKMRGIIVKMQRSLQALEKYDNQIIGLSDSKGDPLKGFVLDLANKKGGIIYIDAKRLKEAKELLAEDIQNITDASTGYDKARYDISKWEKNFLFGDNVGGSKYNGIFKMAQWDAKKKKFVANDTPAELHKNDLYMDIISKSISPYKRLLQLGTNIFSEGKAQKVQYEDIISYVNQFDYDMSSLNRKIYWELRKSSKYKNRLNEIDEIFLTRNGQKKSSDGRRLTTADFNSAVFGNWNNSIRPDIVGGGNAANFSRMLPFERAMVTIAAYDRSKISKPEKLFGEEALEFDKFFEEHFHSKNFDEAGISFVNRINKNNGFVNYLNYLDYKIKSQSRAKANAYRNGQSGLAKHLETNLEKLELKKRELEEKLIFENDATDSKTFAYKIREGSKNSVVSEIIRSGRLPRDWKSKSLDSKGPSDFSFDGVRKWAKSKEGIEALNKYVKRNPVRFRGIQSMEHLELIIWDNMLEPMKKLVIGDDAHMGSHMRQQMAFEVRDFKKAYGKLWSDVFSGRDPLHDQSRANSEVMYALEQKFLKWEEQGGYGRLFMFKLMAPEADPYTYTYLKLGDSPKILPAFKSESLSFIKLGLKFFNQTKHIDEFSKNNMFEYITAWHNSSFRAFYGQRSNRNDFFNSYLSDLTNERVDVMRASPLLDDITPYKFGGGMQQQKINPEVAFAFGLHPNQSIGTMMSNEMLFPSAIKTMAESTMLSYTPKAYINAAITGKTHPAIHGYKDYDNAVNGAASALLGDAFYKNLVYEKTINHFKGAHHEVPSLEGNGRSDLKSTANSKLDCY